MRILVTGGAGFIGHHLVTALVERGDVVSVLDDLSTGDARRLTRFGGQVRSYEGSILDRAALDEAMAGCELVFHEAALPSVARSVVAPDVSNQVNVSGSIEVMLAAARNRVRRVVFAGSSSVYGIQESLPSRETDRAQPVSPYGVSKLAAEHYVRTLGQLHRIDTVSLRYFNVFGPGQDPRSEYSAVVPRFVTAILEGRTPTIYGTGAVSRDFTYVDNVVAANLLAARMDAPSGSTFNIACGDRHSVLDLVATIGEVSGRHVEPAFAPPRVGDILHSMADITLARRTLGYEVVVPFREGIARTVEWYRASGSTR